MSGGRSVGNPAPGAALAALGLVVSVAAVMTDAGRAAVTLAATAWLIFLLPLSMALLAALPWMFRARWLHAREGLLRLQARPGAAPLLLMLAALLVLAPGAAGMESSPLAGRPAHLGLPVLLIVAAAMVVWTALARWLSGSGRTSVAVIFLAVFLPSFWWVTDDWFSVFAPACRNSLSGFYQWTGLLLLGVGWLAWREAGRRRVESTPDGFRDLSRFLLFACCCWLYAWFCRYLPVWYAGLPVGSECLAVRVAGSWRAIHLAVPVVGWLVPCVLLLSGRAKDDPGVVRLAAGLVLAGRWLDLYLQMVPEQGPLTLLTLAADHGPMAVAVGWWLARGDPESDAGWATSASAVHTASERL